MNSAASCLAICEANPLAHVCVFTQFSNGGSCGVYDTNLTLPLLNLNGLNIGGTDTTWTCNSTSEPASGTPQDFVNAVYSSILEQAPSAAQLAAATNDTSLSGCAKIVTNVVNSSAAAQLFNGDALGYDIVNRFYHGILGRPSDAGGFHAYWQVMVNDYLQSQAYGASQIAASMTASTSTEFIARCQAFGFKN